MNLKLLRRKGMGRWVIGIAAAALLLFLLTGSDGLINVYRLHRQLSDAKTQIRVLNGSIDSLHQEIRRLQTDTLYIERMARERLGMARPDERVYKFSDVKE
jgi:cell division protein FtsB